MLPWRSVATATNITRCIGITATASVTLLTTAALYHGVKTKNDTAREGTRLHSERAPSSKEPRLAGALSSILLNGQSQMEKIRETIMPLFETPVDHKRELRHVIVPCGDIDFDVFVLGTNHRTLRSSQDVKKLLNLVRPDVIFVELCRDREEMLYDDQYVKSEYYAAAKYRLGVQVGDKQRKTPYLLLGDRPCRVSDQRWWEGLETAAGQLVTYLLWPFILPVRDRLWGHEIVIDERDIFMAYKMYKSCAYYIEEQAEIKMSGHNNGKSRSTCTQWKALKRIQKSSLTLNDFFQASCLDSHSEVKEPKQNPSIVAIIGSNHLDGVCALLENESVWSPEMMLQVVETERHSRNHPYTLGIAHDIEEYDQGVRECSNRR